MKNMGKLTLTITEDYCHLEVIELFKMLQQDSDLKLFAITSDIDNLGEFIAHNGRAKGQNLVDYYTNIISEFILITDKSKKINNIVFIPAGEEVSILGLCKTEKEFDRFMADLENFVEEEISRAKIQTGLTGVTFGGKIINEDKIVEHIEEFIQKTNDDEYQPVEDYYSILEQIRTVVAPYVDKEKFRSLNINEIQEIIFLRNIIYHEVLEYKSNTNDLLKLIAKDIKKLKIDRSLFQEYGLSGNKKKKILEIKNNILFENENESKY